MKKKINGLTVPDILADGISVLCITLMMIIFYLILR